MDILIKGVLSLWVSFVTALPEVLPQEVVYDKGTYDSPPIEILLGAELFASSELALEPCSTSSTKSYMDYRAVNDETSEQWYYIYDIMHIEEDGYLYDEDGYIGVALGSAWGKIGDRFIIRLNTGIYLKVIKIEEKADKHTVGGCEHKDDGSVIEFVIDATKFKTAANGFVFGGNFNNSSRFKGSILSYIKVVNILNIYT